MAKAVQPFVVELKTQQLFLSKIFSKKILLLVAGVFILSAAGYSQGPYYSQAGGGTMDGTVLANWNNQPNGSGAAPTTFDSGYAFIIQSGDIVTTSAPWELSTSLNSLGQAELEISPGGTFSPNSSLDMAGIFSNDGTYNNNGQTVILDQGATLAATQPTVFDVLTVNAGTLGGGNTVFIDPSTPTTITIQDGGTLNLTNGYFNVGAANTLAFAGSATINDPDESVSDFANLHDGTNQNADVSGGTIGLNSTTGGTVTVNGTVVFNNITTAGGNGDVNLNLAGAGTLINGTLTIKNTTSGPYVPFAVQTASPVWGTLSSLVVNNGGNTYTPGLEWLPLASGSLRSTPGYPNNVTLTNMGIALGGVGFDPTGTWAINGTLTVGVPGTPGKASVADMTLFTSGGIAINANSLLKGNNIVDKGNWTRSGVPIGTYSSTPGGTVTFAGSGTSSSPQAITVSSGTETEFSNVGVNNFTYVKLFSPVTLPATGSLDFTAGIIETSSSHLLTVANSSPAAVSGGAAFAYVNGPMQWSLASGSSNTYDFPVGSGTSGGYYPFSITPNTPANNATVQAFAANSGGTADGTTISLISHSEYWKMTTSTSLNSGSSVSLTRPSPVAPNNRIGESATQAGVYTSVGGTASTFSIDNSSDIGTSSPFFFVMADTTFIIPVRFVDVKALLQGSHALVQWQVADQQGIVAYNVERSTDDIHFTAIGQVPATALLYYNFTDAAPADGINYYRIASVENSSNVDYSKEASVVCGSSTTGTVSDAFISISPNPVTGSSIGIKMSDAIPGGVYIVSLANSAGQNIYNTSITHTAGNSIETITPAVALEPGTYYLSVSGLSSTGTDKYNLKVIVVH